jgi:redox-sensitive bicupin YhaK (pirin superfamily)
VQRMTAGTGVTHSEYNHSASGVVHFLQIWILPIREGLEPAYEQRTFARNAGPELGLVASHDGRDSSVMVHQNVSLYRGMLNSQTEVDHTLPRDRHGWLQMIRGTLDCNGETLRAGDGATLSPGAVRCRASERAEFLFFDLP